MVLEIARISTADGAYSNDPLMNIDDAHRLAVAHRGVWLFLVLVPFGELLLVRRSVTMATCPDTFSIIGEHHFGREDDDAAAARALREELPGLVHVGSRLTIFTLRDQPRWFLYDYPASSARGARYDRCLIREYVVALEANRTEAVALLAAGREREQEHEAAQWRFEPLDTAARMLQKKARSFCAPELFAPALLDSVGDVCERLRVRLGGKWPHGCGEVRRWAPARIAAPTLSQKYDLRNVVVGGTQPARRAAGQRRRRLVESTG